MKDQGRRDACPNGNDRTRHLVWKNAKGDDRDASQCSELEKVENHPRNMRAIQACYSLFGCHIPDIQAEERTGWPWRARMLAGIEAGGQVEKISPWRGGGG